MGRKVRHVHARDDEYIVVHRDDRSYSGASYSGGGTGAECVVIIIFACIFWGIIINLLFN